MGCSQSQSQDDGAQQRRSRVVPSAVTTGYSDAPVRGAAVSVGRQSSATSGTGARSSRLLRATAAPKRGSHVVQSNLKVRNDAAVNQYKKVSAKPIGKGFQSKVYLVEDTASKSRTRFAMKVLNTKRVQKMADRATDSDLLGLNQGGGEAWIEVQVAKRVQHKNLVGLVEVITNSNANDESIYLILELMAKAFEKQTSAKREQVRRWGRQLLCGLSCLHDAGVVHRDIKVDNCLLSPEGVAKLGDFGLAHMIPLNLRGKAGSDWLQKGMGSRKFRAPEVIVTSSGNRELALDCPAPAQITRRPQPTPGRGFSGFRADVWALGCVLFSLVVGSLPFEGRDKTEQVWNILNQPLVWPRRVTKDPTLHDLLEQMLQKDPMKRIMPAGGLGHRWFARDAGL